MRLRFRLTLNERDLLTDTVPRPVAELPPGVRVYSVQKLVRGPDRAFTGEAVVAFYRPGAREIPSFGVPWVQVVTGTPRHGRDRAGDRRGCAGHPGRQPGPAGHPGSGALGRCRGRSRSCSPALSRRSCVWFLVRRRKRAPAAVAGRAPYSPPPSAARPIPTSSPSTDSPQIERERWPDRGAVDQHYEAAIDVLRDYLGSAEEIPARERTSSELLWAMPPRLTEGGLRRLTSQLLTNADLVKFARRRPDSVAAAAHLRDTRELLRRWHETADAVR